MSNYVTTTKFLAICLIVLRFISSISLIANGNSRSTKLGEISWGIIGALIHGLLLYGAHKKNKTVLTVWIVIASLELVVPIYFLVLIGNYLQMKSKKKNYQSVSLKFVFRIHIDLFILAAMTHEDISIGMKIFDTILLLADVFFHILAIVITAKAKKKIDEEENGGSFVRLY